MVMVNIEALRDITQSIQIDVLCSGTGIIEDTPWRRSGFSQPYHVISRVQKGRYTLILNNGMETLDAKEGDCIYIPAQTWRQSLPFRSGTSAVVQFFHFNFLLFKQIDFLELFNIPTLIKGIPTDFFTATLADDLTTTCTNDSPKIICELVETQALGFQLLSYLLKRAEQKPQLMKLLCDRQRFFAVFKHIAENYHRPVSLKELASIACLSVSAFHASFKDSTGLSPLRYLREQRINEARKLLFTTDMLLGNIADTLGYSDQFSFSKSFKRTCGQSPTEYRMSSRQEFQDS
jgi:AraC family transcriptional regulator, arabinose operon regulatory protein